MRTWRPERDRQVLLVLDTGRTSAGRVGDVPRLDAALDAALLLAALASRAGDRVDLLAVDRAVRAAVEGAGRDELLARIVDAMAVLEPALVETDGPAGRREVLRRSRRRSLVVLFTTLDAAALQEGLLPGAGVADPPPHRRARRGRRPPPRRDARGPGRRRRRSTTPPPPSRPGRSGRAPPPCCGVGASRWSTPPPDAFAPAVADAYLSLKAAGRL